MSIATSEKTRTEQTIEKIQELAPTVAEPDHQWSLPDLIRLGATLTKPTTGWGSVEQGDACALSAAAIAAEALGLIPNAQVK
jgi:hypothetical protein